VVLIMFAQPGSCCLAGAAALNAIGLFVNGLLGMVFGLVLGFLEGRQFTEARLRACVPASYWLTA
jgi:hypothetical protein